jgi:hypothetical protein
MFTNLREGHQALAHKLIPILTIFYQLKLGGSFASGGRRIIRMLRRNPNFGLGKPEQIQIPSLHLRDTNLFL